MTEMVERVASAILTRSRSVMGGPNFPTPDDCEHIARAAIEAMRDPTSLMARKACNALKKHIDETPEDERAARSGWSKDANGWRVPNKEKHRVRYQAMIDAALK